MNYSNSTPFGALLLGVCEFEGVCIVDPAEEGGAQNTANKFDGEPLRKSC